MNNLGQLKIGDPAVIRSYFIHHDYLLVKIVKKTKLHLIVRENEKKEIRKFNLKNGLEVGTIGYYRNQLLILDDEIQKELEKRKVLIKFIPVANELAFYLTTERRKLSIEQMEKIIIFVDELLPKKL